jgi:hypothetical protein
LIKTKSVLDNQDIKYYKTLICQDSKSVDNYLISRDSGSHNARVSTNRAEVTIDADFTRNPKLFSSQHEKEEPLSICKPAERSKYILDSLIADITKSSIEIQNNRKKPTKK